MELTCKLSAPELRLRKQTVINCLKKQILVKPELTNGYAYTFNGSDKIIDELTEFIKAEHMCCDFFNCMLLVNGDKSTALLEITGPEAAKNLLH